MMRRGFVKIDQDFSPQLSDESVYCRVTRSSPSPLPSTIGDPLGNANPVWVAETGVMVLWSGWLRCKSWSIGAFPSFISAKSGSNLNLRIPCSDVECQAMVDIPAQYVRTSNTALRDD